jgi:hypothetical protein
MSANSCMCILSFTIMRILDSGPCNEESTHSRTYFLAALTRLYPFARIFHTISTLLGHHSHDPREHFLEEVYIEANFGIPYPSKVYSRCCGAAFRSSIRMEQSSYPCTKSRYLHRNPAQCSLCFPNHKVWQD